MQVQGDILDQHLLHLTWLIPELHSLPHRCFPVLRMLVCVVTVVLGGRETGREGGPLGTNGCRGPCWKPLRCMPRRLGSRLILSPYRCRLLQLTWLSPKVYSYHVDNFEDVRELRTPLRDGWGATSDGHSVIVSDGSNKLAFLDPDTLQSQRSVDVWDGVHPVRYLNEVMRWAAVAVLPWAPPGMCLLQFCMSQRNFAKSKHTQDGKEPVLSVRCVQICLQFTTFLKSIRHEFK